MTEPEDLKRGGPQGFATQEGDVQEGSKMVSSGEPILITNVRSETVVVDHVTGAALSQTTGATPVERGLQGSYTAEELQAFIQSIAHEIVIRRMSVPAVFALELMKPLSFVGASSLTFMGPILEVLIDPKKIEKMTCILEDRDKVEALLVAIETLEKQQ